MNPAWSVILLTTLLGAGQGLFLALYAVQVAAAAGMLAEAPRAFFVGGAAHHLQVGARNLLWIGATGTVLCIALFVCTAMIYACLKFLQEWYTTLTPLNYFLLGTASGFTLAALLAALAAPGAIRALVLAALTLGALGWLGRLAALRRNARLRPKSTLATAIGVKHPRIEQKAQGFTGGSFNTREFFHGRPREIVRAVRWTFLVLVFPVPGAVLAISGDNALLPALAFASQYVGLLAERWYFFAEANHPQNLYYQAMS